MMEYDRGELLLAGEKMSLMADEQGREAVYLERLSKDCGGSWIAQDFAADARKRRESETLYRLAAACVLERASTMSDEDRLRLEILSAYPPE